MHLLIAGLVLILSAPVIANTQTEIVPLETEVAEEEKPPEEPAKRLTWRDNPKDCDLKTEWIRADNFGCIPIPESEPTQTAPTVSGNKQDWLIASGIPESSWTYVDYIISHESGWNPNAVNASSGACGLGQQLPCGKWPHTWNDPVGALIDANSYALQRYGSWANAYSFWLASSWW